MTSATKTAIVTGAGSGIGRAVALALLANGYRVALAGRREDALRQSLDAAGAAAERGLTIPTNVSDAASGAFAVRAHPRSVRQARCSVQ